MANTTNLQDTYLNKLRKEKVFLTVILMNGFQLRGVIKSFDNFTVLIETDGKQQLIFKHAISTFAPSKNVDLDS
ncbi:MULTISPECIES: RNA chaperone Hfq [Allobacillus]|uniref:RNA-binding protein Hfq n=1 Tax=Allobacillus halotolerans TaxID=570278 RepID=A0ABS6GQE8_9BACI|nr:MULTISPECIES: RNA chaperone Hfq [Allobacillus]MBU6081116.1 RNA chaperone Hfq [Allobacillus halotolerans]TSJ69148.1 RNA chaperone Hfq [Allobacillus sp. SKP2-8]